MPPESHHVSRGFKDAAVDSLDGRRHLESEMLVGVEFAVIERAVERGRQRVRVTLMGILCPTPYFPPVQPVFTSQQFTLCLAIRERSRLP